MNLPGSRFAVAAAAATLTAATLGCGTLGQVKQAADNLSAVGEMAEKLGGSDRLTFTAEYKLSDGSTTTVVQQPPNAAYVGKNGRFIVTSNALVMCDSQNGRKSCQRAANISGQLDTAAAGLIPTVAGTGFISTPIAIALLSAASLTPGAQVTRSTRRIANQEASCLKATGIRTNKDPGTSDVRDFTVCVTDSGLLAAFSGSLASGEQANVELTSYTGSADPTVFAPPAGYQVINVDRLPTGP